MMKEKRVIKLTKINTNKFSVLSVSLCLCVMLFSQSSCSFDYYEFESNGEILPDLVMENVEYVRVQSAEPQARFQADRAERFETQSLMLLENISFEQFGSTVEEVNAEGFAENASIEIDTGNITLENNVTIEVESENIILKTELLAWQDEARTLSTGDENKVFISMSDGTSFTGIGFFADARRRTWEFRGAVEGEYIFIDDEEDESEEEQENE